MIANGFKPVGWVAAVGAAALSCYMLSLRVASERADVASLDRKIVSTQQQIRALQTELGTRGRLQQLEQWNDEVLALSAPISGQYLQSGVQLARFGTSEPQPLDNAAEVRMASAETAPATQTATPPAQHAVADSRAAAPQPAIAQPMVQRASLAIPPQPAPAAERPATAARRPAVTATTASAPRETPARRPVPTATASRETPAHTTAPRTPATTAPVRVASAETRPAARRDRPAAVTTARQGAATPRARSSALLDDSTLRDLGTASRAERRGGTRD